MKKNKISSKTISFISIIHLAIVVLIMFPIYSVSSQDNLGSISIIKKEDNVILLSSIKQDDINKYRKLISEKKKKLAELKKKKALEKKKKLAELKKKKALEKKKKEALKKKKELEEKQRKAKIIKLEAEESELLAKYEADSIISEVEDISLIEKLVEQKRKEAIRLSDAQTKYIQAIKSVVEGKWVIPHNVKHDKECTVILKQLPSGTVTDVKLHQCNADKLYRETLINAVWNSSPLPLAPDTKVFDSELILFFDSNVSNN